MELTFVTREESGWRGPGAPRKQVPDHVVEALRRARDTEQVGVISVRGEKPDDIEQVVIALRAGARHLGHRIRIQRDRQKQEIRFMIGEAIP